MNLRLLKKPQPIQSAPLRGNGRYVTNIHLHSLTVAYDHFVALSCDDAAFQGNVIAILGHNGAGKSTLIKSMLGLLPPLRGSIDIEGIVGEKQVPLVPERHMAFCPETGSVFADITVESYIKLWCRVKHGNADYYMREGSMHMELLNLAPLLSKLGRELSKGQRRRVQTAIGFLTEPKLFLFDEPFDGLDVQKTNELSEIILSHTDKMSFVVSSHRMDVVERLADLLVVLDHGKVRTFGSVAKVCETLAEQSVEISNLVTPVASFNLFKQSLPNHIVSLIGDRVTITGPSIDPINFASLLQGPELQSATISRSTPCLVDAMNYHLKNVGG